MTDSIAANAPTYVMAAGGTGGHVFPAQATAEALKAQGARVVLITDKRCEKYVHDVDPSTLPWDEVHVVSARSPSGSLMNKMVAGMSLGKGTLQARSILKKIKPAAVAGFGGYPAFPALMAARMLKCPTILHEQNAILGRANRWLAEKADALALSFENTGKIPEQLKSPPVVTGNPVREAVYAAAHIRYPGVSPDGTFHLLVMGGSLGAKIFSDVVPEAVARLPEHLRRRLRIDQQCREADLPMVRAAYDALHVYADLAPFFNDVPRRLASAHLVLTRAGASSVSELIVSGRPAWLVPYPHAMDDHQTANASAMEALGGAWLIPEEACTAETLHARLEALLTDAAPLEQAAAYLEPVSKAQPAASHLARLVMDVAGRAHTRALPAPNNDDAIAA